MAPENQTQHELLTYIREDIRLIKRTLLGNGQTGLVTKVDRNTRWVRMASWVCGSTFIVLVLGTIGLIIRKVIMGS